MVARVLAIPGRICCGDSKAPTHVLDGHTPAYSLPHSVCPAPLPTIILAINPGDTPLTDP